MKPNKNLRKIQQKHKILPKDDGDIVFFLLQYRQGDGLMNDMQIVSAQDMRQLDALTIKERQITSYQLMEEAGTACFDYIYNQQLADLSGLVVVIAGPGNNGGDAVVVYKRLLEQDIHAVLLQVGNHYSDELNQAHQEISKQHLYTIKDEQDLELAQSWIEQAGTVIDGIFGIGLARNIEGIYKHLIELVNHSYATTISIDIPSGIQADNGLVLGLAIKANHTLAIQNYKQGHFLNDGIDYCGEYHLLDVGILQTLFPEQQTLLHPKLLHHSIPKRIRNSYKYMYGNVLTIGGSKGMMGAPILAALAALRMGSGLSQVLHLEAYSKYAYFQDPNIMMSFYDGIEEIPNIIRNKSAIVFGPGLGRKDEINLQVLQHLLDTDIPLVIDADGIYYLKQLLPEYNKRPNIIITPHYKELSDFLGISIDEVKQEPILLSKNIAHTYNLTVVLKGACTIITNENQTFFSTSGNPGLATAGTGDVLSGILGNLLGRGMSPLEAAKLGVLFHSKAAEFAREDYTEESMIASDVIDMIPKVMTYAKR
jgi:NAD(P)H-hydrate epimerase